MLQKIPEYFTLDQFESTYLHLYKSLQKDHDLTFIEYHELLRTKYLDLFCKIRDIFSQNHFSALVDTYFNNIWLLAFLTEKFGFRRQKEVSHEDFKKLFKHFIEEDYFNIGLLLLNSINNICEFIENEILRLSIHLEENKKASTNKRKGVLKDTEKLALAYELGFFKLLKSQNMPDDKINRIMGLFLEKDPKEFVYKNVLNINSKNPNYQTDKYTAYQYLEPMKKLIDEL